MGSKLEHASNAISASKILTVLSQFCPHVVSTIFVGFDTEHSDIDIVCDYQQQEVFSAAFESAYSGKDNYVLRLYPDYAVGRFNFSGFLFEVYASKQAVQHQFAYRHYCIMQRLSSLGGTAMKQMVRELKNKGLKTEPAICQVLGLRGDPYTAILELESWSDEELLSQIKKVYRSRPS